MMLSHNPGHRVVLGSRVAVPIAGDYYAAATVQAVRNDVKGSEYVTVKFDDNNQGECPSSEIVGDGFKSIHDIKLQQNQKVYSTHNGHEVMGSVEEHFGGLVRVNLADSVESIIKREEDVRLIESRYSPRLQEHNHDPDYRRIASANASPNHPKKRPVSESIEVPRPGRARKSSAEPTMDDLMAAMVLSSLSSSPIFYNLKSLAVNKGSSPHSFSSSGVGSWGQEAQLSPIRAGPMSQTTGVYVPQNITSTPPERTRSVIQHTHSVEHSPSSTGDPIEVDTSTVMDTSVPMDEDSDDYNSSGGVVPPGHSTPAPFQSGSPRTQYLPAPGSSPSQNPVFQGIMLESVKEEPNDREEEKPRISVVYEQPRIYYMPPILQPRPEYMVHLQPVGTPPPPPAAVDERQYRELGQFSHHHQADLVAPTFYTIPVLGASRLNSNLAFSPRRTPSPLAARSDRGSTATPPYQGTTLGVPSHPIRMPMSMMDKPAQPINIPGMKAFSWHAGVPQSFSPKPSIMVQRQHMHQAASPKMSYSMSPKTLSSGRKVRGDGKKCRKVYGMENRDMWCTACRWKKACQRFPD